ncbi:MULTISPECIES: 5-methylcytosine restriction system specificity protein McrC [Myroides]|uniref:5-methylcytosine restriction system specificity protein McrC n=1 Tax=Myroides TaxID=76831 RepID=UPI0015FE1B73|nr:MULTISPECIES: restriction endonuclease [Myroides]MBB1149680.1 restriction endonuclease [Myroides sp. NP-2]MEC4077530.1 restriction endonuclease [Myroides odoratimimus]MEC4092471.1 restriction endonuclease [Myroides odoratimimus]
MGIRLSEHQSFFIRLKQSDMEISDNIDEISLLDVDFEKCNAITSKSFNNSSYRFLFKKKEDAYEIKADYCIGIDWLGKTGKFIYVEPKVNNRSIQSFKQELDNEDSSLSIEESHFLNKPYELDYLSMLLQVTSVTESNCEVKDLVQIDWDSQQIAIEQKDDKLTPFLIIHFLQTLKTIVKKGLKKSYYKIQENLNNRVKGKIVVGQHIKQNVFKNRLTSTFCEYQVFGEDHLENRFLKKVLKFVISYVENNKLLLSHNYNLIQQTVDYCRPTFELISDNIKETELKHIKYNPFYSEYKDALQIGSYILKRFAYNITQTSQQKVTTPPFWIDMPRLFELYVFSKMIEQNTSSKKEIHYQLSTHGNALDILVSHLDFQMVIDAKYKLHYNNGHLHQDIRQVAGYARLKKVREKLKITDDRNIDCLIIYPDIEKGEADLSLENINLKKQEIKAYHKVFKLGVKLPWIEN